MFQIIGLRINEINICTTSEGLIIIPPSKVVKICRANSIAVSKTLGAYVLINADQICFLTFNSDGNPCFFMSNGYEVSINFEYSIVLRAFENAKSKIESDVE